jgi:hypothetical protein
MFTIMLAALFNTVTAAAPGAPAVTRLPFARAAIEVAHAPADEEHLLKARVAMLAGQLDLARREFIIAAALDRDAGRVPTEATFGLARVLYGQNREAEAARLLDELATEALRQQDVDCAALALNDALWLHLRANRRADALADGLRLTDVLNDTRLSDTVRREVRGRFK